MTSNFRRQLVWFVIIIIFIFIPTGLFAQEETETPDVPTVTATLAPTELPTSTAIPTSTNTATVAPATVAPSPTETVIVPETTEVVVSDTPVAEVTDEVIEPTLTVTNAVQAQQTETAFPTTQAEVTEGIEPEQTEVVLQPEPEPELTAIVSEPFLSETNADWSFGEGWQLVPLDGNYALQANGVTQPATYIQSTFADVAVEALVQGQEMTIELYLRQSEAGSYHLSMSPDGTVAIHKDGAILASTTVANNVPNQWRHIRLSAIGHTLRASIDSVEVLVTTDAQPLPEGDVSFVTTTEVTSISQTSLIDNIRIWIPSDSINNPTSTPTLVASDTAIPPTEQFMQLNMANMMLNWDELWQSDFEELNWELESWFLGTNATIVNGASGKALQLTGGDSPLIFEFDRIYNVAIDADIYVTSNSNPISLTARESTSGYYSALISSVGNVTLQRGQTVMATNTIQNFIVDTWHHVRMEVYNDTIRVLVDNVEIIAVQDMSPLPMGRVIVADNTLSTDSFTVDNINLWMPYDEIPWRRNNNTSSAISASNNGVALSSQADITIGTVAGLRQAIMNCSGALTIGLSQNITITDADPDDTYGQTGLPPIYCDLTIIGNGYTINRSTVFNTPLFRIFTVDYVGSLTLDSVNVFGGRIQSGSPVFFSNLDRLGAGIFNRGILILKNNTSVRFNNAVENTQAPNYKGGGVYSSGIIEVYEGVNISNNGILLNSAASILEGAGISATDLLIQGSPANPVVVSNNRNNNEVISGILTDTAVISYLEMVGNARAIDAEENLTLTHSIIQNNQGGVIVDMFNGSATGTITNSIISNNSATNTLRAIRGTLTVSNSCITGNQSGSIKNIFAENNWWGDPLGPGNEAGSTGDVVDIDVDYDPWLTTKPTLNLWGNECEDTTPPIGCTPQSNLAQQEGIALLSNDPSQCSTPVEILVTTNIVQINPDGFCSLIEAIHYINGDTNDYGCHSEVTTLQEGSSRIILGQSEDYVINAPYIGVYEGDFGANGLPVICCNVIIEGNGSTITRTATNEFRIFEVGTGANVTFQNLVIANGTVSQTGGAAIFSQGLVTVDNVTIQDNAVNASSGSEVRGAGIYSFGVNSTLTITASTFLNNIISNDGTGEANGGAIAVDGGQIQITYSDFRNNEAGNDGNILFLISSGAENAISNSCFVDNNLPQTTPTQPYDLRIISSVSITVDVSRNWWNDPNGYNQNGETIGITTNISLEDDFTKSQEPEDCTSVDTGLSSYGIEVIYDGDYWTQAVQDEENANILSAVELISDALAELGVEGESRQERFRAVFVTSLAGGEDLTITFLRLPPSDQPTPNPTDFGFYYDNLLVNCWMNDAEDSISVTNLGYVVACRGFQNTLSWQPNNVLQTETVIHELGHVINARFALSNLMLVTDLYDCRASAQNFPIMRGTSNGSGFLRGIEGWGSISSTESDTSRFQQNPSNTIVETAPDMFLNWVYRITSNTTDYFSAEQFLTLLSSNSLDAQRYLCGYQLPLPSENDIPQSAVSAGNIQISHDVSRSQWEGIDILFTGFRNINGLRDVNGEEDFADNNSDISPREEHLPGNARYVRTHRALKLALELLIQGGN